MAQGIEDIRLLLTGGGTGGHLFPAVATAQELRRQYPAAEILFVGTRRKIDSGRSGRLASYGFASDNIVCYGIKGKNVLELLKAAVVLPYSYLQARRIIQRFRPDVIFGVGGYVTGPVVAAGKRLGVPVVLHEQNSVPGLANRKLAGLADRICLSLPDSGGMFPADKVRFTGNPVRQGLLELAQSMQTEVRQSGEPVLAVVGGSQGAVAVNSLVMEALQILHRDAQGGPLGFSLIHQSGETDFARVEAFYREHDFKVTIAPFFATMEDVYNDANLLIARGGATTLAELAVLGKPAIVVPYPYAADNHQEKNAAHYAAAGGVISCKQSALTGAILAEKIRTLLMDRTRLSAMGRAMQELAYPDAAQRIVACCLEVMKRGH